MDPILKIKVFHPIVPDPAIEAVEFPQRSYRTAPLHDDVIDCSTCGEPHPSDGMWHGGGRYLCDRCQEIEVEELKSTGGSSQSTYQCACEGCDRPLFNTTARRLFTLCPVCEATEANS